MRKDCIEKSFFFHFFFLNAETLRCRAFILGVKGVIASLGVRGVKVVRGVKGVKGSYRLFEPRS